MKLYIQLGQAGDILNILPLLYADHQKGEPSSLMVAREFAPLLKGCSYLTPIVFDGEVFELQRAIEQASQYTAHQLIVSQVNGPESAIKDAYHRVGQEHAITDSFAKESWHLAQRLHDWKRQLPLVFDRRSPEREAKLLADLPQKKKPLLLVAADGVSAPFPFKRLLLTLLQLKYGKAFNIVELPQAERLYDLLGLYEKAHCVIAVDSAPLHLAYAIKTLPVVALINDDPSLWHGSPWRPNHVFHCRYQDFPNRVSEMFKAIDEIGSSCGSVFNSTLLSPKIIHVYNRYEPVAPDAEKSWRIEYTEGWVSCGIERGATGRDSHFSPIKDSERFPFLKDVLRLACLRAEPQDIICLTKPDTIFSASLSESLRLTQPCFAHRTILGKSNCHSYHSSIDLFAFTKDWWQTHQNEMPDLIMGRDIYWPRVLSELIKLYGGQELPFCVYQKPI